MEMTQVASSHTNKKTMQFGRRPTISSNQDEIYLKDSERSLKNVTSIVQPTKYLNKQLR